MMPTTLDGAVTNAQGRATFATTAAVPDLVGISISHPTLGEGEYADMDVITGGTVTHIVEVPH